jgi:hypothetical protein
MDKVNASSDNGVLVDNAYLTPEVTDLGKFVSPSVSTGGSCDCECQCACQCDCDCSCSCVP